MQQTSVKQNNQFHRIMALLTALVLVFSVVFPYHAFAIVPGGNPITTNDVRYSYLSYLNGSGTTLTLSQDTWIITNPYQVGDTEYHLYFDPLIQPYIQSITIDSSLAYPDRTFIKDVDGSWYVPLLTTDGGFLDPVQIGSSQQNKITITLNTSSIALQKINWMTPVNIRCYS